MDIVTHRFPLDRIQDALELAARPTAQSLKILIRTSMRATTPKRAEVIGEEAAAVVRAPLVPSKMMAAVLYGSEDLRLEKIDVPPLAADEVLLRVRLALTDWHRSESLAARLSRQDDPAARHLRSRSRRRSRRGRQASRPPLAPGPSRNRGKFRAVPTLLSLPSRPGESLRRLALQQWRVRRIHAYPRPHRHGKYVEVPHSVDDGSAALVEPLACVLRGIHEMEVRNGDTAVVIGCGPIGLKYVRMLSRAVCASLRWPVGSHRSKLPAAWAPCYH